MPKRSADDIDPDTKRAKVASGFPERPTRMAQWLHDYDSIQVSGQLLPLIWSNTEASKALADTRAIVEFNRKYVREADHAKAAKYSEYLRCTLITDALDEHMRVPYSLDDLTSMVHFKLEELVDSGEHGAAMALLVYPHGTVDAFVERHDICPRVVEHLGPDGTTYRFIWFGDSEKDRSLDHDDRRPKPRLIPIIPGVCDDTEMLRTICEQGGGHMRDGLHQLRPWLASLGLPDDVRSARKLGATLLFQWLVTSARDLMDLAPVAYLTWLNLALGHRPRSNQWATYLCGWRA
jgi:hypothetical protein